MATHAEIYDAVGRIERRQGDYLTDLEWLAELALRAASNCQD